VKSLILVVEAEQYIYMDPVCSCFELPTILKYLLFVDLICSTICMGVVLKKILTGTFDVLQFIARVKEELEFVLSCWSTKVITLDGFTIS
jgi:hypothetical protein